MQQKKWGGGDTVTNSNTSTSDTKVVESKTSTKSHLSSTKNDQDPGKFVWDYDCFTWDGSNGTYMMGIVGLTDTYLAEVAKTGKVTFDQTDYDYFTSKVFEDWGESSSSTLVIRIQLTNYGDWDSVWNRYFTSNRLDVVKSFSCTCSTSIPIQFYFNANNSAGGNGYRYHFSGYETNDVTQPTNLPNLSSVDLSGINYTGALTDLTHQVSLRDGSYRNWRNYQEGAMNCFVLQLGALNTSGYSFGPTSLSSLSMPNQAIFGEIDIIGSAVANVKEIWAGSDTCGAISYTVKKRVPLQYVDLSKCRMSNISYNTTSGPGYYQNQQNGVAFDQCCMHIRFTDLSEINLGLGSDDDWFIGYNFFGYNTHPRNNTMTDSKYCYDTHTQDPGDKYSYYIDLANNRLTGAYLDNLAAQLSYRTKWASDGISPRAGHNIAHYWLQDQEEYTAHQEVALNRSTEASVSFDIDEPFKSVNNCVSSIEVVNTSGTTVKTLSNPGTDFKLEAGEAGSSEATKVTIAKESISDVADGSYTLVLKYGGISTISWSSTNFTTDVTAKVKFALYSLPSPNLQYVANDYSIGNELYMGYGEDMAVDITMTPTDATKLTATSSDETKVKVEAKGADTREGHEGQYLFVISTASENNFGENTLQSVFDDYVTFTYNDGPTSYAVESLAVDVNISKQESKEASDGLKYRTSKGDSAAVITGVGDTFEGDDITISNHITIDGKVYDVTGIMQEAFSGNSDITSVKFDSVGSFCSIIGDSAFKNCENLESVSIPAYCLYVGTEAFADSPVNEIIIEKPTSGTTNAYLWTDSFNGPMYVYNSSTGAYDAVNAPEGSTLLEAESVALTPGTYWLHRRDKTEVYDAVHTVTVNVTLDGQPCQKEIQLTIDNTQAEETSSDNALNAVADYKEPATKALVENGVAEFGYEFTGLTTDIYTPTIDHTSVKADAIVGLNADSVFSVEYTTNTHTVTFDANGHGTAPAVITSQAYGTTITKPADLTADGYTFGGWFKDAECVYAWDFANDTMPDSDLTLYAKWTANSTPSPTPAPDNNSGTAATSSSSTQTGDYTWMAFLFGSLTLVAAGSVLVVSKKRK